MERQQFYTTETDDMRPTTFQFIKQKRRPMGQRNAARTNQVKAALKRIEAALKHKGAV